VTGVVIRVTHILSFIHTPATTDIYTLSLHDALPIFRVEQVVEASRMRKRALERLFQEYVGVSPKWVIQRYRLFEAADRLKSGERSEEHTSELQSRENLVCRLLLEKKKQ